MRQEMRLDGWTLYLHSEKQLSHHLSCMWQSRNVLEHALPCILSEEVLLLKFKQGSCLL